MSRPHLVGYTDEWTVRPGDEVAVKASAHTVLEARIELVRVGFGTPDGEVSETSVADFGDVTVRPQRTLTGSCVVAPHGPPAESAWIVAAFVMATRPRRRQAVMAQGVGAVSWWLGLDDRGRPAFEVRGVDTNVVATGEHELVAGAWYALAGSIDPGRPVRVEAVPLRRPASATAGPSKLVRRSAGASDPAPSARADGTLLIAAAPGNDGGWLDGFDGKIASPRIWASPWSDEVGPRISAGDDPGPLVAGWDFGAGLERSDFDSRVARSVVEHVPDGEVFNSPLRAATGHDWDGAELDFTRAPEQYAAIHFHHDDLDDCRWRTSARVTVPRRAESGTYAVRMTSGSRLIDRVPLFVRPARPTHDVAFLAPTASYLAYGNDHPGSDGQMAQAVAGKTPVLVETDLLLHEHREWGHSCYDVHADGSGIAHSSHRRPLLNMRPTHRYHVGEWQYPADLAIVSWLDDAGVGHDVLTDEVLHAEGSECLAPYRVIVTATHPEYWSTAMLDGLEAWLGAGGRLVNLGANGFYWRVGFDRHRPWIMEIRRGQAGSRAWESAPGECHLASTGELGGLWRHLGRSPQALTGVGYAAQGFDRSGFYRRMPDSTDPRASFVFEGVDDETFGTSGRIGGGAVGQEIDRYDIDLGTPADALLLATSEGLSGSYLRCVEELGFSVPGTSAHDDPRVRSDVVYHVRPSGGAVFSTGSIAWAGSLGVDTGVDRITRNVLSRFSDPAPLDW